MTSTTQIATFTVVVVLADLLVLDYGHTIISSLKVSL